ncbi:hypothetical protein CW304_00485 [Bacillus sp. UFRGS-B20]|nr:hypothetical protein CW304_00485 [Bacillus sp. UFRGS-B20]
MKLLIQHGFVFTLKLIPLLLVLDWVTIYNQGSRKLTFLRYFRVIFYTFHCRSPTYLSVMERACICLDSFRWRIC